MPHQQNNGNTRSEAIGVATQIASLQTQVASASTALGRIETRLPELSERLAIAEQNHHHLSDRLTETARRLEGDAQSRDEKIAALEVDRTLSGVSSGGSSGGLVEALRGLDAKQVITAILIGLALFGSAPAQQALGLARPPDVEQIVKMLEARDAARDEREGIRDER